MRAPAIALWEQIWQVVTWLSGAQVLVHQTLVCTATLGTQEQQQMLAVQ
jgi:hypothetical protein